MDYGSIWALSMVIMTTRGVYKMIDARSRGEVTKFSKTEQWIWWILIWSGSIIANKIATK